MRICWLWNGCKGGLEQIKQSRAWGTCSQYTCMYGCEEYWVSTKKQNQHIIVHAHIEEAREEQEKIGWDPKKLGDNANTSTPGWYERNMDQTQQGSPWHNPRGEVGKKRNEFTGHGWSVSTKIKKPTSPNILFSVNAYSTTPWRNKHRAVRKKYIAGRR